MDNKIKIQVYSRSFPGDKYTGAKVYLLKLLEYLNQIGFEIELIILDPSPGGRSPIYMIQSDLNDFCKLQVANNIRIKKILFRFTKIYDWILAPLGLLYYFLPQGLRMKYSNLDINKIISFITFNKIKYKRSFINQSYRDKLLSQIEVPFIIKQIKKYKPDVILVNYVWLSNIFEINGMDKDILTVILTHEVIHKRTQSAEDNRIEWNYHKWDRNWEAKLLNKADLILAIHDEDKALFEQFTEGADILAVPMPVRLKKNYNKQITGRCLFVGSGGGSTNKYGITWFLEKVWPIILHDYPFATLHICGSVCYEIDNTYSNVYLKGVVKKLEPEYSASEICVAPLIFGSGLKIKIIEALSYGRVSVTTRIGAQGLNDIVNKAIIVEDNAKSFADAVMSLMINTDKRRKMETYAKEYVSKKLSPNIVYKAFIDRVYSHMETKNNKN